MVATYDDLRDDIDRIAKFVAKDFPDIDWEDVRQHLVLFVLERGKSIKLKDEGGQPNWILKKVAQTYCKDQRVQHLTLSPQYAYRPSDVMKLLELAFTTSALQEIEDLDLWEKVEGFDLLDMTSDVKRAFDRLKHDDKVVIFRRFAVGIPPNDSYERKKLNKAVNTLTYNLNSFSGEPGDTARKVRNTAASYELASAYDGSGISVYSQNNYKFR